MAKRKNGNKIKENYFGEKEEKAVVAYNNATSTEEKHRLYNNILKKPFQIMIESILRRYSFHIGNYDTFELEQDALTHLIQNMHKYDPNKIGKTGQKARAYSYYQTIIKNFYNDHSKNSYKEKMNNLVFEDHFEEIEGRKEYTYEMDSNDESELKEKLINLIILKIRNRIDQDSTLKKNEIIVGEAIINVLANWHLLFQEETDIGNYNKKISNNFAKNKILLFLKEQTNLSTKEIRTSMNQYKILYFFEKNEFFKDEC